MGIGARVIGALIGEPVELPVELAQRYPELSEAKYRRGGLPVRIGWVVTRDCQRRGNYALAHHLHLTWYAPHSGTALARVETRLSIFGKLDLSFQLPLAIHSLRLHT